MNGAEMTFTSEFRSGFRATLTISLQGFQCSWSPELPRYLKPTERTALIQSYRTWRDECLQEFARSHNLTVRTIHRDGLDCIAFSRNQEAKA